MSTKGARLESVERVAVIGPCGSGKSHASMILAHALQLPLVHLDVEYWKPGWIEPETSWWHLRVHELANAERWVIDGSYALTLDTRLVRAQAVVFLDLPTHVCLWSVLRRELADHGRVRRDMAPGCPERIDIPFLWFAFRYRAAQRPALLRGLSHFKGTLIVLKSRLDVDRFLADVKGERRGKNVLVCEP